MTPEELTETERDLYERAYRIRVLLTSPTNKHSTLPPSVTYSLRLATQALDDAAAELLNAFGADLPKGMP